MRPTQLWKRKKFISLVKKSRFLGIEIPITLCVIEAVIFSEFSLPWFDVHENKHFLVRLQIIKFSMIIGRLFTMGLITFSVIISYTVVDKAIATIRLQKLITSPFEFCSCERCENTVWTRLYPNFSWQYWIAVESFQVSL